MARIAGKSVVLGVPVDDATAKMVYVLSARWDSRATTARHVSHAMCFQFVSLFIFRFSLELRYPLL